MDITRVRKFLNDHARNGVELQLSEVVAVVLDTLREYEEART